MLRRQLISKFHLKKIQSRSKSILIRLIPLRTIDRLNTAFRSKIGAIGERVHTALGFMYEDAWFLKFVFRFGRE